MEKVVRAEVHEVVARLRQMLGPDWTAVIQVPDNGGRTWELRHLGGFWFPVVVSSLEMVPEALSVLVRTVLTKLETGATGRHLIGLAVNKTVRPVTYSATIEQG